MDSVARQCLSLSTPAMLAPHRDKLAVIFAHWATYYDTAPELVTIAFARIINACPEARPYAISCLSNHTSSLEGLSSTDVSSQIELLVAVWRLLRYDLSEFGDIMRLEALWSLLRHGSDAVRFIVVNILSLVLDMTDKGLSDALENINSEGLIIVLEDGATLDLRAFEVQENIRVGNLRQCIDNSEQTYTDVGDLPANIVQIAGVFLPRITDSHINSSQVVPTLVSNRNLSALAQAVATTDFILVQGLSGSGKTFLIEDLARSVGRDHDLVRIHLGDQTDAKLLLGTYVTSVTPGEFVWQSGVLANAVSQGKWLLIEDIDKAPSDVLSVLLPLLESRSVHIASRAETIRAGPGLKVFATKATDSDKNWTSAKLLGGRLWTSVTIEMTPNVELREVIIARFPLLANMASTIMDTYGVVSELAHSQAIKRIRRRGSPTRSPGTLDLFKWCRRIQALYMTNDVQSADQPISAQIIDDIFSEAIDCFASSTSSPELKVLVVQTIGRSLHIPPERVQFYLESHTPELSDAAAFLRVGRASIGKTVKVTRDRRRPFALTAHASRLLEQLVVAIRLKEPLLLVGETGTGKTTIVQQLATMMGHNLVAINMSQQTESGDLLGGFKPIDTKLSAVPLLEMFETLFDRTLSAHKNARFLTEIRKSFNKSQWSRLIALLRQALKIARKSLTKTGVTERLEVDSTTSRKKRKFSDDLMIAWTEFASNLDTFSAQQQQSSKSFAFAFVKGALIKAVERGDWVLLDEINLAASDTLESISGLLQENGSILLSETGDVKAITPHPDFRIFSCMNPATDVGKRDLPAGIRSRFTELYIHSPDSSMSDLLAIITKYIGGLCIEDSRACTDVAHLYNITKRLTTENRLVDGGNQCPHYSIRTLTRTLSYVVEISSIYGLRRSLYEGFCMSYLTLLNKESEAILKPIIEEYTILRVRNLKSAMTQIPRKPIEGDWVQFKHYWLPKGPFDPVDDPKYIMTPFVERNMLNLVRAATTKKYPILLQGPTSSGKTSMVEFLAKKTGHKFVRINNHEHTDLQEYLGSYMSDDRGVLAFQEGILVQAVRKGHWLVLDELNLAPSDVLEALNRLLDDNRELLIPETQEVLIPHPSFVLFATQNPAGLYGGRKHLSRAFRNRFLELHFEDIPEDELETILCQRCQVAPTYCRRIVEVYKQLSIRRQSSRVFEQKNSFATLRDLFRWATRPAVGYDELALNGYILLAERVRRSEEKLIVQEVIEKVMKVSLSGVQDYNIEDLEEYRSLVAAGTASQVVWTRSMRRLFILVSLAFRNNEPVLLVGETGCGKTAVCQLIAQALSRPIQILNAHQNTETADMIGAQRPVRDRAQFSSHLASDLGHFLKTQGLEINLNDDVEALRLSFESLDAQALSLARPELAPEIDGLQHRIARSKALFEWADGPLVQAMKEGEIFLLDEISLAEDAVLERLNSVLETGRTLTIAEKGTQDASIIASAPYQFCATMNPGGDFGKKELSAALRNRFTEIWVATMPDDTDMLQILSAKLRSDRAHLGTSMIEFARFFCTSFSTALTSSMVSLRDLLAWVEFINRESSNIEQGFVQGAALVYIDALGATMHGLDRDELSTLRKQRQSCLNELTRLLGIDCTKYYETSFTLHSSPGFISIGPYSISTGTDVPQPSLFELQAPTTFLNATRVFRAMQLRKPILLEGSPGVGKTSLISAIASMATKTLVRINFSDQTDLMDLFGSDSPVEDSQSLAFAWRDAPFLRAMQSGDWVLLDEMNLASQSILEGLNACLDHRAQAYIPELNRTFDCHPDFRIFAAQNPHSQGGGRKGLPESFVNRFTVVYCDPLSSSDIAHIAYTRFPGLATGTISAVTDLVFKIQHEANTRKNFAITGGPWEFNLRDVFRWLSLIAKAEEESHAAYYADFIVRQRFRTTTDRELTDLCVIQSFGDQATYRPAFASLTHEKLLIGRTCLNRSYSKSPAGQYRPVYAHLRGVAEAVLLCVEKSWPCILVGSSGTGKSVLLQSLAKLLGQPLHFISMNNDMDASDLLGSFEQRDKTRTYSQLCHKIEQFCKEALRLNIIHGSHHDIVDLIGRLDLDMPQGDFLEYAHSVLSCHVPKTQDLLDQIVRLQGEGQNQSLGQFQWSDGSLLRAVMEGTWLVLDNANLCNPSVLDRLNSLLEPNGQLLVNERIMPDGSPMLVTPHPNFRLFLTMDPAYGELSRAMRNRGLEVFLLSDKEEASFLPSAYSASSSWASMVTAAGDDVKSHIIDSRFVAESLAKHLPRNLVSCQLFDMSDRGAEVYRQVLNFRNLLCAEEPGDIRDQLSSVIFNSPQHLLHSRTLSPVAVEAFESFELFFLFDELRNEWNDSIQVLAKILPKSALHDLDIINTVNLRLYESLSRLEVIRSLSSRNHLAEVLDRLLNFAKCCHTETPLELLISTLRCLQTMFTADSGVYVTKELRELVDSATYLVPLSTGSCMAILWSRLRPVCPVNETSLTQYEKAKTLLRRLDRSAITNRSSLEMAVLLKKEYLQTLDTIRHSVLDSDSADADLLRPTDSGDDAADLDLSTQKITALFKYMLKKVQLTQVVQFDQWQQDEAPLMHHLLDLSTKAGASASSLMLLDFLKPAAGERSFTARFWSLCRNVLSSDTQDSNTSQPNESPSIHSFSQFLYRWTSLLSSGHELSLGSVQRTLDGFSALGEAVTEHNLSILQPSSTSLEQILRKQVIILILILASAQEEPRNESINAYSDNDQSRSTYQWSAEAFEQAHLPSIHVLDILHIGDDIKATLGMTIEILSGLKDSLTAAKDLAMALIHFSRVCLLLYVPNVPRDPGMESILHSNYCKWKLQRHQHKAIAQANVHKTMTGGSKSPEGDLLAAQVQRSIADSSKAPGILLYRPRVSQLHQIQVEYDFCLSMAETGGSVEQLSQSYLSRCTVADVQLDNFLVTLSKMESRLLNYSGYQDVIAPILVATAGLQAGLRLLAEAVVIDSESALEANFTMVLPNPLDILSPGSQDVTEKSISKEAILSAMSQIGFRASIFGVSKAEHRNLRELVRHMFEEWFVQREREMVEAAQDTSLYKHAAPLEPSTDDYRELFPDYESTDNIVSVPERDSDLDDRIFAEHAAILTNLTSNVNRGLSLQSTLDTLLDLLRVPKAPRETAHTGAAACMLSTATYAASRNIRLLQSDQVHRSDHTYDFYRSANITETKKLVPILSQLQTKIHEIISVWPENSVLLDIDESLKRLMNASMACPVAQCLTMLENIFGLLAQWQEVASRQYAVDSLFALVREQIVDWRRLELSCWPRLFGLEERQVARADAKMWYNLYEVLVFTPARQEENLDDDFLRKTVQLLMQFMQSSTVGQYNGRLELLAAFSHMITMDFNEHGKHSYLEEAVRHVLYHYSSFLPQIRDFVSKERLVLTKEVNQVIKLASWKDTNVFALRESSRRSHRTLYKIVHKYRRVLLVPSLQLLSKGLQESKEQHQNTQPLRQTFSLADPGTLVGVVPVTISSLWPARYQYPLRTARKILSISSDFGTGSVNWLQTFLDDALASMVQLRSETPATFDKSKLPLIKHLKNRKRKLLSDSFKTLKELGLRSVIRADDLDSQKDAETLFLSVPAHGCNDETLPFEQYFYRIVDILPSIRAGYANHAEDVTSSEVKRGIGYFDCLFSHMLKERATLSDFYLSKERFESSFTSFTSLCFMLQQEQQDLIIDVKPRVYSAWCKGTLHSIAALKQLLQLTDAYHQAYRGFAAEPGQPLADVLWWQRLLQDIEHISTQVKSSSYSIYPRQSWKAQVENYAHLIETAYENCRKQRSSYSACAYVFEHLLVWLNSAKSDDFANHSSNDEALLPSVELNTRLSKLCDTILLASQKVTHVMKQNSVSDENMWYVRATACRRSRLKAASLSVISTDLENLIMSIQTSVYVGTASELQRICTQFGPILQAYGQLCHDLFTEFVTFHTHTSRCTLMIGRTLQTLATSGFCSPQPPDQNPGQTSATEDGTGLGTGEGKDDITKDLEDDEDLGDLEGAEDLDDQSGKDEDNQAKEIDDDLAGSLEDINNDAEDSDEDASGSEDGADIEDEIGEVDEDNETALDEKMWDSEKDDLRNKETEKKEENEAMSNEQDQDIDLVNKESDESKDDPTHPETQKEQSPKEDETGDDEQEFEQEEETQKDQDEAKLDEAHNLDLPEDMDLDDEIDINQDQSEDEMSTKEEADLDDDQDAREAEPANDQAEVQDDQMDVSDTEAASNTGEDEIMSVEENNTEENPEITPTDEEDRQNEMDMAEGKEESAADEKGGDEAGGKEITKQEKNMNEQENNQTESTPDDTDDLENPDMHREDPESIGQDVNGSDGKTGEEIANSETQGSEEIRSLGVALEEFRRQLHINDATSRENESERKPEQQQQQQTNDQNDQFEHIADEEAHDTQVMGPKDQEDGEVAGQKSDGALPDLEDNIYEKEELENDETQGEPEKKEVENMLEGTSMEELKYDDLKDSRKRAPNLDGMEDDNKEEETEEHDLEMTTPIVAVAGETSQSAQLWQQHQQGTRDLANGLCEQLRLILEPTMATKMKGDFRTGKRLNMRRIIPYIASQFKKDKIWMRRSKPSKRQYQVMLAIDDSRSMSESSSIQLAFDTVALVSTALSVLEVGQMSVVKFGAQPEIVHAFRDPFTNESGAAIFESFTFNQAKTDMKALAAQSVEMFREARATQHSSATELWQLQFIISDGICEDHDSIKRIMRQAQEERIMVVFLVIDTIHGAKKHSILQMSQVKYLTQADGSKKLHIMQYMEEFAFENFLIIQDVRELPELLCSTIRQFFAASQ